MADNSPFAVQQAPYPNIVNLIAQGRILQHVLTFTGANGTAVMLQTLSSAGCTVTYVAEGNYSFTFPAGGTGAIGWVQICPIVTAGELVTDARFFSVDSDILNFATGAGRFIAVDGTATPILSDIIGTVTLLISVVKAVV